MSAGCRGFWWIALVRLSLAPRLAPIPADCVQHCAEFPLSFKDFCLWFCSGFRCELKGQRPPVQ
jgi:hypothetical protein